MFEPESIMECDLEDSSKMGLILEYFYLYDAEQVS